MHRALSFDLPRFRMSDIRFRVREIPNDRIVTGTQELSPGEDVYRNQSASRNENPELNMDRCLRYRIESCNTTMTHIGKRKD